MQSIYSLKIVRQWLERTIIELNLCPFAKRPFENDEVHIAASDSKTHQKIFLDIAQQLEIINSQTNKTTTSLLAFPSLECNFEYFYELCLDMQDMIDNNGLKDQFQLVAFHPQFQFKNLVFTDKANFVNRSPYPTIHILRSQDMEDAMQDTVKAENLSLINEKNIKGLSNEELKYYFWFLY